MFDLKTAALERKVDDLTEGSPAHVVGTNGRFDRLERAYTNEGRVTIEGRMLTVERQVDRNGVQFEYVAAREPPKGLTTDSVSTPPGPQRSRSRHQVPIGREARGRQSSRPMKQPGEPRSRRSWFARFYESAPQEAVLLFGEAAQ